MSETRRILSLADLGGAFPGAADRASAEYAAERMQIRDAGKAGRVVVTLRPSRTPVMNSSGTVTVQGARIVSITESLARRPASYIASDNDDGPTVRDFRAAMMNNEVRGYDPAKLEIPAEQLALYKDAKRILLVGHTNPDHDTVGATLTLARALKALGKHVDVCIDDELSHTHQRFAGDKEILRAADLHGNKWDLAVVVDVARSNGIGEASALLKCAKVVSVIDHHEKDHRDDIERRYGAKGVWHDGEYDAAAIQVCGVVGRLLADHPLDAATAKHIYAPALGGMATDCAWGSRDTQDPISSRIFKHVMTKAGMTIKDLEAKLHFEVPPSLRAAIDYQAGLITRKIVGDNRRIAMVVVSTKSFNSLLASAREKNPKFAACDLMTVLKAEMPTYTRAANCSALVVQQTNCTVVSARSNDGRALELCRLFRGGGKRDAASATLYGGFDVVQEELVRVARNAKVIS